MSVIIAVFPSILLFISEVMPFLPTKYNGIVHSVYECLKEIYDGVEVIKEGASHDTISHEQIASHEEPSERTAI